MHAARLRRGEDIARVRSHGLAREHKLFSLRALTTDQPTVRVAVAASRAVGGAVQRNRARRRVREAIRIALDARDPKSGADLVVMARPGALAATVAYAGSPASSSPSPAPSGTQRASSITPTASMWRAWAASVPGRPVPSHGATGAGHVAFSVEDGTLERWAEGLRERGIEIEQEHEWQRGGSSIYVRDPAGNSVELVDGDLWPR